MLQIFGSLSLFSSETCLFFFAFFDCLCCFSSFLSLFFSCVVYSLLLIGRILSCVGRAFGFLLTMEEHFFKSRLDCIWRWRDERRKSSGGEKGEVESHGDAFWGGGEDERFERRNENFVDLGGVCGRTSGNKEKE